MPTHESPGRDPIFSDAQATEAMRSETRVDADPGSRIMVIAQRQETMPAPRPVRLSVLQLRFGSVEMGTFLTYLT